MNFDFTDGNKGFMVFKKWMVDFNLTAVPLAVDSPTVFTYCHQSLGCSSYIDHIVVSNDISQPVSTACTLDSGGNLSDHLPIYTCVSMPLFDGSGIKQCDLSKTELLRMRWDKADLQSYYHSTYWNMLPLINMDCLHNCGDHCCCNTKSVIDDYYMRLVQALKSADAVSVPRKKVNFYKFWCTINTFYANKKSKGAWLYTD
jgi:hypothetical protein